MVELPEQDRRARHFFQAVESPLHPLGVELVAQGCAHQLGGAAAVAGDTAGAPQGTDRFDASVVAQHDGQTYRGAFGGFQLAQFRRTPLALLPVQLKQLHQFRAQSSQRVQPRFALALERGQPLVALAGGLQGAVAEQPHRLRPPAAASARGRRHCCRPGWRNPPAAPVLRSAEPGSDRPPSLC